LAGFGGLWRAFSGFIGLYRVLSGFIGFYPVLSGFIGFYPAFIHRTTATRRHRRAVAVSCDGGFSI
jgi:hypothetical protein